MAIPTLEEVTQEALVLTGDSVDTTQSGTTLVGYILRETFTSVWTPWASQNDILEQSYMALTGDAWPGDIDSSNGLSFFATTVASGNRDLAELTYDYLITDQLIPVNTPLGWTNEGLMNVTITWDFGFQGTTTVTMPGVFRGYFTNGYTQETAGNPGTVGKIGRFAFTVYLDDFLKGDFPTSILDTSANPSRSEIRAFSLAHKNDITNFKIDWVVDASSTSTPASELLVNVPTIFNDSVCLPGLTAGNNLVLDSAGCITTSTASGTDDYVNSISGILQSDNMVDITLGYVNKVDETFPDAIDLSDLVDSTTINTNATSPSRTPTTVTTVTFESTEFKIDGTTSVISLVEDYQSPIDIGHYNTTTNAFVSVLEPATSTDPAETLNVLEFDDRHFTVTTDGMGGARILGSGDSGIRVDSPSGSTQVDVADIISFAPSDFTVGRDDSTSANSDEAIISLDPSVTKKMTMAFTAAQVGATAVYAHTVTHSLSAQYPTVAVYDNNNQMVLPMSVSSGGSGQAKTITITFPSAVTGNITLVG